MGRQKKGSMNVKVKKLILLGWRNKKIKEWRKIKHEGSVGHQAYQHVYHRIPKREREEKIIWINNDWKLSKSDEIRKYTHPRRSLTPSRTSKNYETLSNQSVKCRKW